MPRLPPGAYRADARSTERGTVSWLGRRYVAGKSDITPKALGEVSGEFVGNLFDAFELMAEQHPHEPHRYLFLLATSPEWQGCGPGSARLRPTLDMYDRDAMPAYLEASTENQ